MTVVDRTSEWQSAAREHSAPRPPRRQPGAAAPAVLESRLPVSVVTLIAAIGVFVASAAYTAGRMGYASSPWADRAYWLGQALVVAPVALRLLSRRSLVPSATATLIVVLTVAEYLLKICYSPLGFTFTDELLHWRGTVNLVQTGKLFTANYGLPISPRYPGLEEVTSALISVTGLPVFAAGLIVSGLAHLLFICLLYLIFSHVSQSHRVGGIAILVYSGTPTLDSFDSMFVYETLALAFLGLGVLAAWRAATGPTSGERIRWFVLALLAIFATVITHHVTSYMLVGSLVLVTVASVLSRARHTAFMVGALAIISAAAVASWVIFIAPGTLSYFRPTVEGLMKVLAPCRAGDPRTPRQLPRRRWAIRCWKASPSCSSRLCCRLAGGESGSVTVASRGCWPWPSGRSAGLLRWRFGSGLRMARRLPGEPRRMCTFPSASLPGLPSSGSSAWPACADGMPPPSLWP